MNSKNLLFDVRNLLHEIKIKQAELNNIRDCLLPKGIRYDTDPVQTSPTDPLLTMVERMEPIEKKIQDSIANIYSKYEAAYDLVEGVKDPEQRQVLHLYFLSGNKYSLEQIGRIMCMSRRTVYRRYKDGLDSLP